MASGRTIYDACYVRDINERNAQWGAYQFYPGQNVNRSWTAPAPDPRWLGGNQVPMPLFTNLVDVENNLQGRNTIFGCGGRSVCRWR